MENLHKLLQRIDGKGYKAYKDIKGTYQLTLRGNRYFTLSIDHVQGDPFAAPSRFSIRVPDPVARVPSTLWLKNESGSIDQASVDQAAVDETRSKLIRQANSVRRIALEDFIGRHTSNNIGKIIKAHRGSGCSGLIAIDTSEQQVLLRNAIIVDPKYIEARIVVGLPANGRRVAGQQAIEMIFDELPEIVFQSLLFESMPEKELRAHINSCEDQHVLRSQLKNKGLVGFVANNAILPRQSGISDKPLQENVIPFRSPSSLEVEMTLPNAGTIIGMGIPDGVTVIVGGGFHGKSTLLHALERGPYNHIPGDGREKVVTLDSAVKVRAEDGRAISRVNISPFIDRLPFGRDTREFSTENASGSTSQAANIIEAFECGTELLLIDEDTSATNFMIRDERMQKLVSQEKEPITPLVYRIRELYEKHGVSSVIVMGGSGDYFDIADTVIMLDAYVPKDVTQKARLLAQPQGHLVPDNINNLPQFSRESKRMPGKRTLDASRKNRDVKIDTKETITLLYGEHRIDLALVEQLIDIGQTRSIGLLIYKFATDYAHKPAGFIKNLQSLLEDVALNGLDVISPYKTGNLALPRLFELAAAINRIRCDDWISTSK